MALLDIISVACFTSSWASTRRSFVSFRAITYFLESLLKASFSSFS